MNGTLYTTWRGMLARSLLIGFFSAAALYAVPLAAAQTVPTCFGQPATIVGTSGDDTLQGTEGPDVIFGGGGSDRIDGLGGDDLICGRRGGDVLFGGDGNDKLYGGRGSDFQDGGAGDDLILGLRVPHIYSPYGENLIGGSGNDRLIGTEADDTLVPGEGDDLVRGRGGNDLLRYDGVFPPSPAGGIYVDLALGEARGQGFDRLFGVESAYGTNFDDVLLGNSAANYFGGGGGADVLRGRGGNDSLGGGSDSDRLYGGSGRDEIGGGQGRDVVYGNYGDDRFFMAEPFTEGLSESDVVWGGPGSDWAEADTIDHLHSIEQAAFCC
jgi:Ca2+-binding RTX toxin-like protein